jgi:hypothetical protein
MRTLNEIHADIDRATDRRTGLWKRLSEGRDTTLTEEIQTLNDEIETLWAEHRALRAQLRFGDRDRIVARARAEERLERAA